MLYVEQRIVSGAPASVTLMTVGNDGEPFNPGTLTAEATFVDGTSSSLPVSGSVASLSAAQTATLGPIVVAWSVGAAVVATTTVEVVGGVYFANAELRAAEASVQDGGKFPPALVTIARRQVEARFERWTGRAFVPRFATFDMTRASTLILPVVDVRAVTFDGGALPSGVVVNGPAGLVSGVSGSGRVRVGVEFGLDAPPPDVKAAAMRLCREVLARSKGGGLPENAISYTSTEAGWSAVLVTPGVRGAQTSIPEVNEVVTGWTFDRFGVA